MLLDENTSVFEHPTPAFKEKTDFLERVSLNKDLNIGKAGEVYKYKFTSTDPNGDDVYYYIEWEDGSDTGWIGSYPSGEEITLNHTWEEKGTYTIRARAKDTDNLWGAWGDLEVTMPKNQQVSNMWFLRWLERFPILQKILYVLRLNIK